MRLSSSAWQAVLGSCLCLLLTPACGSSHGSNVNGGEGTGATGTGANGSGATGNGTAGSSTGPDLGVGGSSTMSGGGSDTLDPTQACAGEVVQGERIPLDIYIMLDQSGSMLDVTEGNTKVTKWQAVSSALADFVSDPASAGIGVGLQLFPQRHPDAPTSCTANADCNHFGYCFLKACWNYPGGLIPCNSASDCGILYGPCQAFGQCSKDSTLVCSDKNIGKPCVDPNTNADAGTCEKLPSSTCTMVDDCRAATYATPAADIAALPAGKAALLKVLQMSMPDGGLTPTQPALTGAVDEASAWAKKNTDHQVAVVLATDGLPTLKAAGNYCAAVTQQTGTADINAVINEAHTGVIGTPSISTFVIGVVSPTDVTAGAPDILDAIATGGGTDKAFIVDTKGNVQQQFRDALDSIRKAGLSCDLAIPKPGAGETLDYDLVNVDFSDDPALARVDTAADCTDKGGWYYDVPPAQGTPTRIVACPVTCDAFKATDMGSVKIQLGCKTRVVVK